jgi:hypothetical protein
MPVPLRPTREGQSVADYLIRLTPNIEIRLRAKESVDPLAARSLFAIWNDEKNKIKDGVYRRPTTISAYQVEAMQKAGLAKINGNNVEITEKGAGVIKVMVLGDDSSTFDTKGDKIIDYAEALQNTKRASTRRGKGLNKKSSADWWDRFE